MSEPTPIQLPERYELLAQLGQGGMGTVWRVLDQQFDRPLALKLVRSDLLDDEEAKSRFEREATITGRLQHPAIPPLVDRGALADGTPYFSMKLVEGATLAKLLEDRAEPTRDLPHFLGVFEQICQGVGFAHSRGFIHRDLKPANIMVGAFGEVQVMDWGMAKGVDEEESGIGRSSSVDSLSQWDPEALTVRLGEVPEGDTEEETNRFGEGTTLTRGGQVLGTLAYMPPEQARGDTRNLGRQADVFALGGILCKILTGQPPYVATSAQDLIRMVFAADLTAALDRLEHCQADHRLVDLCRDCLQADPARRPANASEVAQAVRDFETAVQRELESEKTERAAAVARSLEARKRQRVTLVAAALIIALILVLGGGAWWRYAEHQADIARAAQEQFEQQQNERAAVADVETALEQIPVLQRDFRYDAAEVLLSQAMSRLSLMRDATSYRAQLDEVAQDLTLLRRVDAIQLRRSQIREGFPDLAFGGGPDGEFAQAFRDRGFDIVTGDLDRLSVEVRQSRIADQLLSALGAWRLEERGELGDRLAELLKRAGTYAQMQSLHQQLQQADDLGQVADVTWTGLERLSPEEIRMLILDAYADQKLEMAGQLYRVGLAVYPNDFWLNYNGAAGEAYGFTLQERIGLARVALVLRPSAGSAHNNLGALLAQDNQEEAARMEFRRAVELDPSHSLAQVNLAVYLTLRGETDEAASILEIVVREEPLDAYAQFAYGNVLVDQGKRESALLAYQTALGGLPDLLELHTNLANLLSELERFDEALPHYEAALVADPNSAIVHANFGAALQEQGRLDDAEREYRTALRLDPADADSHYNLGSLLHVREAYTEAEQSYRAAISQRPEHIDAWYNLARLLFELERWEEAIEPFEQQLKLEPNDLSAYGLLGMCHMRLERYEDALRVMEEGKKRCDATSPELRIFEHQIGKLKELLAAEDEPGGDE
ncbi:MAG: tetratricopeptide repeat protein [Planctomycetales bacterium]|nr:tetratricopeptide repeat protein [Planctomycetales bacterium]